jgi:Holliday junction resolvase RusA-like endonuclease
MIESQKIRVRGIPYPHTKSTGNVQGCADWTAAVIEKTRGLPKITGPCLLRVTFRLPREKFNGASPFGADLDNLLKRLLDALSRTVFSDAPGKDACVVALEATKSLGAESVGGRCRRGDYSNRRADKHTGCPSVTP